MDTVHQIYFMHDGTGPIKIGYASGNLKERIRGLQTGNPRKLSFISAMPGKHDTERWLHIRFAQSRVLSEWYHPVHELINLTKYAATYARPGLVTILDIQRVLGDEIQDPLLSLAGRMRISRERAGIAKGDLSGDNYGLVWRIEEGKQKAIPPRDVQRIADRLAVNVEWLINGTGEDGFTPDRLARANASVGGPP